MMDTILSVSLYDSRLPGGCVRMEEKLNFYIERDLQPVRTCDDPVLAMATGDIINGSEEHLRKVELRKDAAGYLACNIASKLIEFIESRDRHNGDKTKEPRSASR